jgi:3-hydroxyisobutyrate dehydrogenase-like beta-hydroxyacid dehydrogenase
LALAAGLNDTGIQFLDAPVSGSVAAVEAGTLLVMAGGTAEAIEAAKLVLEAYARRIAHVGPAGSGQAMKLAVNLVVHDLNAALSEALVLAEKAGIARADAYGVLQDSVVGAPFVVYKRSAFLDPSTPVAMSLELVLKDLQLITEFADLHGSPAQVTRAARDQVATVCEAGNGDQDMAALSRLLER